MTRDDFRPLPKPEHITAQLSDGEWWKSQKGKIAGIPTHFRPLPPVPEGK